MKEQDSLHFHTELQCGFPNSYKLQSYEIIQVVAVRSFKSCMLVLLGKVGKFCLVIRGSNSLVHSYKRFS